ncbi:hypothetical protein I553_5914 [Mycobacterium xenopi 4042]|uniref:Uncharacterized protein n=1 Tax=Mycobacterium xenopi 4042 TaxID=1299334 RepID=X8BG60_MYCXE|nr:hypothetical protein I553_5914 [Mycobacterium xenopi 4042]
MTGNAVALCPTYGTKANARPDGAGTGSRWTSRLRWASPRRPMTGL